MVDKQCTKCGETKPRTEFHKRAASNDGLTPICKPCAIRKVSAYMADKKPQKREYDRTYRETYYPAHKHVMLENVRQCQIRRRGHRIPLWANKFLMQEIYALREMRARMLGAPFDVDHIVPIVSELVCGLHCETNLRILPRRQNRDRWNKRWPDMPA